MATKRKPRGPSPLVNQGARVLGRISGRPAALYDCVKAGGIIAVESPGERTVAQLADLDPRVSAIKQQPFCLDVMTGNMYDTRDELFEARRERMIVDAKRRDYTPDFALTLTCGRRVVVEVKDTRYPGDETYQAKLLDAQALLHAKGLELIVLMLTYDPDLPIVFNANLLTTARHSFHENLDLLAAQEALERSLGSGSAPLGEALRSVGLTLREAPALILGSTLKTDLRASRLCAQSEVSLAYGDMSHFELLPL